MFLGVVLFDNGLETMENKIYNAPINVNPVGGGGECRQGVRIWQILKFFYQIPQGGKRKVNQKCQKSPQPKGKKSKQTML